MFKKILMADRGESTRTASASAKPRRRVRATRAGELDPGKSHV
jgi:hypothetical protein